MARRRTNSNGNRSAAARVSPRSNRGKRTRAALVDAARVVFERDGYLDARITDISDQAGVSTGSFYTYFDSKEEVFTAVVNEVQEDMLHPHLRAEGDGEGFHALVDAANRDYLLSYRRNAKLMALFAEVGEIDVEFRKLQLKRGYAFSQRSAKTILRLQERGEADTDLDPLLAALCLGAMAGRMAYWVYVLEQDISFDDLLATLNRLWTNALGVAPKPDTDKA